jgi:CRISPR-associated protein Csb3
MAHSCIPVDLCNPGQVFACLGLMEASEILCGPCEGRFTYAGSETRTTFEMTSLGGSDPVETVMAFLKDCDVVAFAPRDSDLTASNWGITTEPSVGNCFPAPTPASAATLPLRLRKGGLEIPIEHWLDGGHCGRDNVKFWAGSQGKPGAAFASELVAGASHAIAENLSAVLIRPFDCCCPMSGSFRFDWRRDYIPLDAGFSMNAHKSTMTMVGYPLVELLAAIGLQNARPARIDKLAYKYHVSQTILPLSLARALLGSDNQIVPRRTFRMRLGWPGKEGQARCIVKAEEEFL